VVRQELDELMLGEACSSSAAEHLRECAECREFNQQQTRLRQIVGSLGTVAAPADFDFRLRARLANDSSGTAAWLFTRRGFAFATVLLIFATGAVLMRNVLNRPAAREEVVTTTPSQVPVPQPPKQVETPEQNALVNSGEQVGGKPLYRRPQTIRNEQASTTVAKAPRRLVAEDFSGTGAQVINRQEPASAFEAFSLDASPQSFKVSLDDGRGNARTISVPTISFGSQRMLQTGNQFAPKRDW